MKINDFKNSVFKIDYQNLVTVKLNENSNFVSDLTRLSNFLNLNPYENYEEIGAKITPFVLHGLERGLLNTIKDFTKGKGDALLLQGLSVTNNELPSTPDIDRRTDLKDFLSEYLLLGLSSLTGCIPIVNEYEKDGSVIQQVIPIIGKEKEISGAGSKLPFDLHTENIHEVNPPHFFMLFCLKSDKNAMTTFVPLDRVLHDLPHWLVNELFKKQFLAFTGPSYKIKEELKVSILSLDTEGNINVRFNTSKYRMKGLSKKGQKVLDMFRKHLSSVEKTMINLKEGDCLIINNKRAFHGRTAFDISTSYDNRRWLQRIYLYDNLHVTNQIADNFINVSSVI